MTTIVERVNLFLGTKGIKKNDLAQALNWDSKKVYNQLNGSCEISLELVTKLCSLHPELSAEYILLGRGEMEAAPHYEKQDEQVNELKIMLREKDAQIAILTSLIRKQ